MKRFIQIAVAIAIAIAAVPPSASAENAAESRVALPFSFVSMSAEYHIIAWFDGHPEYEAVEAFIYGDNGIRAILTRHGGTQIDVLNLGSAEMPVTEGRDSYVGKCSFRLAANGQDAELSVEMPDGNELKLAYFGQGKPDPKHGGLTDPGNHSPDGGLPAFFREASGVSGKKSCVRIGTAAFAIPVDREISKPPFFTGYRAYLSKNYASMIIPTGSETFIPALDARSPVYHTGATSTEVKIAMRDGVAEAEALSSCAPAISGPEYRTGMHFTPSFPNLYAMKDGETASCRFGITFGAGKTEEIGGTVLTEKTGEVVTVRLLPDFPLWAKNNRAIRYTVRLNDLGATVSSVMDGEK